MRLRTFLAPLHCSSLLVVLAGSAVLAGCGGGTSSSSGTADQEVVADLVPGSGQTTIARDPAKEDLSGFVFTNEGKDDVIVSGATVTLADGSVIAEGGGFGVEAGQSTIFSFSPSVARPVASLTFTVEGSTDELVVTGTTRTGPTTTTSNGS